MKFGDPFTYIFADKQWFIRLAAGAGLLCAVSAALFIVVISIQLWSFLPYFSPSSGRISSAPYDPPLAGVLGGVVEIVFSLAFGSIFGGYSIKIVRNIVAGCATPLPRWLNDFPETIRHGLLVNLSLYVWMIPAGVCFAIVRVADSTYMAGGSSVFGLSLLRTILISTGIGWIIFAGFVFPVVVGRYSQSGRFASAFELRKIVGVTLRNLQLYFLVFVLELVVIIMGAIGLYALLIGLLFTVPYAALVLAGIWGFAYKEALTGKQHI